MRARALALTALVIAAPIVPVGQLSAAPHTVAVAEIDPSLESSLQPGSTAPIAVVVEFRAQASMAVTGNRPTRQRELVRRFRAQASTTQAPVETLLASRRAHGKVRHVESLWASNSLAVTATPDVIRELARRPDVAAIVPDTIDIVPAAAPLAPTTSLGILNPQTLWADGATGAGVVVASLDTGVDVTHPDLAGRYRGGSNSWFDAYGQHLTPTDSAGADTGHGTETMGLMVGGDASGSSIGMAPGAKWIAARIFADDGSATLSGIQSAMQWILDPDGNPLTADAPLIVNNSWAITSTTCSTLVQANVQLWRAAGIVPVFAAGNSGIDSSPGNYPEALSVGAVNDAGAIANFSSRGPSSCGTRSRVFPDVVAPGVTDESSAPGGLYSQGLQGTSFSAPMVSGALALLEQYRSASTLTPEQALLASAHDLGTVGDDNVYGKGRVDVAAARTLMLANPTSTTTTTTTTTAPPTSSSTTTTSTTTTTTTTTTTAPPTSSSTTTTTTTTAPPTSSSTTTTTTTAPPTSSSTTTTSAPPTTTTTTAPPTTTTVQPPSTSTVFADGFETGSARRWSVTNSGGGRLAVTRASALRGLWGVRVQLAPSMSMSVVDRSPNNVRWYHARFLYDPNGSTSSAGLAHSLFRAYGASGRLTAEVQQRRVNGSYQVRAVALLSDHVTRAPTAWKTITDAPHSIEIGWSAATTGTNGGLRLWVDGGPALGRTGLANGSLRIDEVRMGPQALPAGSTGTEYYDAFTSTLGAYIGR